MGSSRSSQEIKAEIEKKKRKVEVIRKVKALKKEMKFTEDGFEAYVKEQTGEIEAKKEEDLSACDEALFWMAYRRKIREEIQEKPITKKKKEKRISRKKKKKSKKKNVMDAL